MSTASDPVRPDELDGLFADACAERTAEGVALAVSGGSDSTALMVLFALWLRQRGADSAMPRSCGRAASRRPASRRPPARRATA
jgi:hypothetical protein